MAGISEEISAKLGLKTADFNAALKETGAEVKKFKEAGASTEDEGLSGTLKNVKKGIREFKELLVAGGIVEAVKGFFELAINQANKSKDANDENAAAVRRFGEAFEDVKEAGSNFAVQIVGGLNRIGEGFAGLIKGAAQFWFNIGEGNVNLEESERQTRKVVQAYEEAKKHAAEWNALTAESKRIEEQRAAAEISRLPLLRQLDDWQAKQNQLLAAAALETDNALSARKLLNEAANAGLKIAEVSGKLDAEAAKQADTRRAETEKLNEARMAALTPLEREKELHNQIADIQSFLKGLILTTAEADEYRGQLAARQLELKKTEALLTKEEQDLNEKSALSEKEMLRIYELQTKAKFALNDAEQTELEMLTLQSAEKRIQVQITEALNQKIRGEVRPAEEATLEELTKQEKVIKAQIVAKSGVVAITQTQLTEEKKVTAEIQQQVNIRRTGTAYDDQSTPALEGVQRRLKEQLAEVERNRIWFQNPTNPDGWTFNESFLQGEINTVTQQLTERAKVAATIQRVGEDAARGMFGDDLVNRAITNNKDLATSQTVLLQSIDKTTTAIKDQTQAIQIIVPEVSAETKGVEAQTSAVQDLLPVASVRIDITEAQTAASTRSAEASRADAAAIGDNIAALNALKQASASASSASGNRKSAQYQLEDAQSAYALLLQKIGLPVTSNPNYVEAIGNGNGPLVMAQRAIDRAKANLAQTEAIASETQRAADVASANASDALSIANQQSAIARISAQNQALAAANIANSSLAFFTQPNTINPSSEASAKAAQETASLLSAIQQTMAKIFPAQAVSPSGGG